MEAVCSLLHSYSVAAQLKDVCNLTVVVLWPAVVSIPLFKWRTATLQCGLGSAQTCNQQKSCYATASFNTRVEVAITQYLYVSYDPKLNPVIRNG